MMKKIVTVFMTVSMILAMVPLGMAVDSSATVENIAPVVITVSTSPEPVDLNPGTTKDVTITATVSDDNGLDDIASVTYNVDGGAEVTMFVTATPGTYEGTLALPHTTSPGGKTITVTVTDLGSLTGSNFCTMNVNSLSALSLDFSSVDYGTIVPNSFSEATPGNIVNDGNVEIDVSELAEWTGISPGTTDGKVGAGSYADIDTTYIFGDANIPVSGSASAGFKLSVPLGTDAGSYSGYITITAV